MSRFYYLDKLTPAPNRLHIGTAAAVFYDGKLLLDWRSDGDFWALVGGAMELGESLEACVRREVLEETGLSLTTLQLLGVFSHPTRIIAFPSGEAVQSITVAFAGECNSDALRLSEESRGMRFFTAAEAVCLPIVPTHQMIMPYVFRPELWPIID